MRSLICTLVLSGVFAIAIVATGNCEELTAEELRRRVDASHSEYRKSISGISGVVEYKLGSKRRSSVRFDILRDNIRALAGPPGCTESEYEHAMGFNREYFFELRRTDAGSRWRIVNVDREVIGTSNNDLYSLLLNHPLLVSQSIANIPLRDLLREEGFELINAKCERDRLLIEFRARKLKCRPAFDNIAGTVIVDSGRFMLVQSAVLTYNSGSTQVEEKLNVTYNDSTSLPLVTEAVSNSVIHGAGESGLLVQSNFDYRDDSPVLEDFTLTAFGLPEPPGTAVLVTPFPYWLVFSIGGLVFLAISAFLKSRWRSRT